MKKKLFARINSFMMAMVICIIACASTPTYAAEACDASEAEATEQEEMSTRATTPSMGLIDFAPGYVDLPYGDAKTLKSAVTLYSASYKHIGTIQLPQNDGRIHRIIYKVSFIKDPYDQGNGDVRLKVDFRRNGVSIHKGEYNYEDLANGTIQAQFEGVSAGQRIEVYADAVTNPKYTSNGNWRKLYIWNFEVYTD